MAHLKLLTLNIGNPSIERAKKQVDWLKQRDEDVIVLTETKNSDGCHYISSYFSDYGYDLFSLNSASRYYVYYPLSKSNDLGVMIISKIPFLRAYSIFDKNDRFFARYAACEIEYDSKILNIVGLYVPSRDASMEKIDRKKEFCTHVANWLKNKTAQNTIICGDFNILSKSHIPHYSNFLNWEYRFYDLFGELKYIDAFAFVAKDVNEYSWVGRTNDGYRYDYIFISDDLKSSLRDCRFIHQTRGENKITDHSAVVVDLDI